MRIVVRPWAFAGMLAFCIAPVWGAAPSGYPYAGTVVARETPVHSGPGSNHYVTGTLKSGVKVEVYRREPNGWLAIRPPQGSISFMRADSLRLSSRGDLAEVIVENAAAWVGSGSPANAPLKWQVRLKKGEVVEILGAVADSQDPQKKLYKISPPAGEFRWLEPNSVLSERPDSSGPSLIPTAANAENRIQPIEASKKNANDALAAADNSENAAADDSENAAADDSENAWSAVKEGNAVGFVEIRRRIEKNGDKAVLFVKPRIVRSLPASSKALRKRLGEIEVEISLMAAKPREQWDFAPLSVEVAALLEAALLETASESARSPLQHLQGKLRAFEALSRRPTKTDSQVVINASAASLETPVEPSSLDNAAPSNESLNVQSDSRFDGVGWVMPVVSRTRSAPPFALMDDNGQVKALLSPAPGVNLHRYVRHKVGVYGQRGFSPSLNLAHVAARQVVILERAAKKR